MFMDLMISSNFSPNQRDDIDDFADFSPARILQIISSDTVLTRWRIWQIYRAISTKFRQYVSQ